MDNVLLNEYKLKIDDLVNLYLNKFKEQVSKNNRNLESASAFMNNYYRQYRQEVARIGVDMLHESNLSKDMLSILLEKNTYAISKLYTEIMNLISDNKGFFVDL